jgi:hypothetical protein
MTFCDHCGNQSTARHEVRCVTTATSGFQHQQWTLELCQKCTTSVVALLRETFLGFQCKSPAQGQG